jgi:hypothetical protein
VLEAVEDAEVAYDLATVDDFSMYRYKHSEMLDLDYLSPTESPFRSSDSLLAEIVRTATDGQAPRTAKPRRGSAISRMLSRIRSN